MMVWTMIKVGLDLEVLALLIASSIASTSFPSNTSKTFHSEALKRALTFSENDKSRPPSKVTAFES